MVLDRHIVVIED